MVSHFVMNGRWAHVDVVCLCLCALAHTSGDVIVRQRHRMCRCQGGDQETREIRGTIKFLKGFWEEMSCSLADRWSGRPKGDCLKPDQIKSCDVCETPQHRLWLGMWLNDMNHTSSSKWPYYLRPFPWSLKRTTRPCCIYRLDHLKISMFRWWSLST